jgi:predicted Zn-dependent protease with MMP-like domain
LCSIEINSNAQPGITDDEVCHQSIICLSQQPMPPDLSNWAREEIERIIQTLPVEIRERSEEIPVTLDERQVEELAREGLDETLGLFLGSDLAHPPDIPLPNQIILYLHNIWNECNQEEELFRQEIRVTYLHELGHFLGLDEIDLDERGLL